MDYSMTAKRIIDELGGKNNINSVTHCMTRLRFNLKDDTIVDDTKVKGIQGVLGVMNKGGQYQVIIGNNVSNCYQEIIKVGGFSVDSEIEEYSEQSKGPFTFKRMINGILDTIAGTVQPILPALIGCGMIRIFLIVLGLLNVPDTNMTYRVLEVIGDAGFYFLPILIALSAAKKFKCTPILAAVVAAVLVHPDLVTLFAGGERVSFLGIPVTAVNYSSAIIPPLLSTWLLSYVERIFEKVIPKGARPIFKSALVLLVTVPITLIILGPLGNFAGEGLAIVITWMRTRIGWLTLMLFSAFMPFIVMTGMHYALLPIAIADLAVGSDGLFLPAMLASNIAQGAASLAVAMRTKNKDLKSVSIASGVSALAAGVTEPALYGVTLKLKKPIIACIIGGGTAGIITGIVNLQSYTLATPSLISIIQFIAPEGGNNFFFACLVAATSFVVTFVLTLLFGFEDIPNEAEAKENETNENIPEGVETNTNKAIADGDHIIVSPINGKTIPISKVNDQTFASGVLGKGIAVIPSEGKVYAPFDGVVEALFETYHALGLKSENGVELLIHVGLETVNLKGKGFKPKIKVGDHFKKGDLLLEMDLNFIKSKGCEIVTPIIVSNTDNYKDIQTTDITEIKTGETILTIN